MMNTIKNLSSRIVVRRGLQAVRSQMRSHHVGVVGAGAVGASCASSLIHFASAVSKISMYDIRQDIAEGEVMDLEDEGYFTGTIVQHAQTLQDLRDCDVVVITAGAKQKPSESRAGLLLRNAKILKGVIDGLLPLKPTAMLLLVTNPVDVLTTLAQKWTEGSLPKAQVIGTGTYLDSQRLRVSLSKELNMSAHCIHAYVLGEHGDSQIVPRSIIKIGGCNIDRYDISNETLSKIESDTMHKAYEIISLKGATNHGIGEAVAHISQSILLDHKAILPVSAFVPQYGCNLGWPSVVSRRGVEQVLPVQLLPEEEKRVSRCAAIIRESTADALRQMETPHD